MRARAFALLVSAALVPTGAPAPATQPVDRAALAPFVGRDLAPGIHLLGTPDDYSGSGIGNIVVIEQSDGIVLIDSGAAAGDGRRAVAYVRSLTDRPVKAVVITHWHNDHPLGVSAIRDAWPRIRVISTAATRRNLLAQTALNVGFRPDQHFDTVELNYLAAGIAQVDAIARGATSDAARRHYAQTLENLRTRMSDVGGSYLVPPTETFTDTLLLDDPVTPVRLMFLGRANTDGDAIAWLPRQRVVVTGDVVVEPAPFGYGSYPGDWIAVLERIKALNFALLIPGHGRPMTDGTYLDRLIGTLTDVRNQVGPLARQGLSLAEVRERVDYSAQSALFGETPARPGMFAINWLTPITESAYLEARGEPITQGTYVLGTRQRGNAGRRTGAGAGPRSRRAH